MNIRQATSDDAKTLAELNGHVQQVHVDALPHIFKPAVVSAELIAIYEEWLGQDESRFWIAEDAGQSIGYIYALIRRRPDNPFSYARNSILVDQMSVNPEYYGTGVADQLMQAVKDWASIEGIHRIVLDVWSFNERAKRFYDKQGFMTFDYRMELMLE